MREGSKSSRVGDREAAQQADSRGSLARLAGAQHVAQIVNGGLSEFAGEIDNAIAFDAFARFFKNEVGYAITNWIDQGAGETA